MSWVVIIVLLLVTIPVTLLLGIPFFMIWSSHKRKMEEISLRREGLIHADVLAELEAVRNEIRALRDTTMQYDLSFDTNLQQMERRLSHLERAARTQTEEPAQQNVYLGGR